MSKPRSRIQQLILAGATRFALLLAFWLILVDASTYKLWFGMATCATATIVSLVLHEPAARWLSLAALLRFTPFFLLHTFVGGLDVARRAVRRDLTLNPTFIRCDIQLDSRPARLFLACSINLLPGTVSCRLREDNIVVHVLDESMNVLPVLRQLEVHARAIFRSG